MESRFSILGRGKAGRSLAAAWGPQADLLPGSARPGGTVLLAVPDRAVAEVAMALPGPAVHMSGSLHLDRVPCAHPLTSFDGEAGDWAGTPLAITGDVPPILVAAFEDLGFLPFPLPAHLKPLYHAVAVLASGHAAELWLGGARLLDAAGVRLPGRGLAPLAQATLRNIELRGEGGRTGPFPRGDEATIARDAAALPPSWREIFLALGRR